MNHRQLLISVYPAAWEWLPIFGVALLGMLGLIAAIAGAPLRLIHAAFGLLITLPLLWLSVAHISDAHLRRRLNAGRELSGAVAMLALSAALLSGMGQFLGSPPPAWSVPVHRWSVLVTLLALALHAALSPHRRVVSKGFHQNHR